MAKLRVKSGREDCAILARHGFASIRQKGSHIVMQRAEDTSTTTVVVPDHAELKVGTLSAIIRQSGIEQSFFEA